MLVIVLGRTTFFRPAQLMNTELPKMVTVLGISILVNPKQFSKVKFPKSMIESDKTIFFKFLQCEKALSPMLFIVLGRNIPYSLWHL